MGAGKVIVGAEGPVAVTVHQPIPQHIVHRLVIPCSHGAKVCKAVGGAVRTAVAGLLRIVRQRNKGRFYRYGPAGHREGVLVAALGRQLDLVPPAVGDGQSVQHIAAVRGDGQGNGAVAAGVGTVGGHFAMLRLLYGDGVGAGTPAASAVIAGGRRVRVRGGSRPAYGDRGQAGHNYLQPLGHICHLVRCEYLRITGRLSKIGGCEHMHHREVVAAVGAAGIGQGDGQAPGGEIVCRGRGPGRATVYADQQRNIIDGGVGLGDAGRGLGDLCFQHRLQLFGGVQRFNVLQSGWDIGNSRFHNQFELFITIPCGRIRQDDYCLCFHSTGCACWVMAGIPSIGGRKGVGRSAVGQGGGPGVARSLRYSDAARTGHSGRAARGQAGQGQRHRAAAY